METGNKGESLASAFAADKDLLDRYGVGDFEKVIMLESVVKK